MSEKILCSRHPIWIGNLLSDINTRSFSKYSVAYFIFHLCLNCGLPGQTKPFVNGKDMSVYYLCKVLSRELRGKNGALCE